MTEREKPISPTAEQIIERAFSSLRETVVSQEQPQEMPPYIIKLPENNPYLTEIDFLGLSNRARNALGREGVEKISELISLYNEGLVPGEIRNLGEKSLAEVQTKLEDFRQKLIEKQAENPGKPVVIEIPLPKSEKEEKEIQKWTQWSQKWTPLINFIETWQAEHPGRRGAQTAAAKHFRISNGWVWKIVSNYQNRTGESLKPEKAISLSELARGLETKPRILVNLLCQGRISFGDDRVDNFYTGRRTGGWINKVILPSFVDIKRIKDQLLKLSSVEETMEHLTLHIAKNHKDTFPSFSKLARQANLGNLRQLPKLYDELINAGFHLRKIPHKARGINVNYYFAHSQESSVIVAYLQEKYQAKPKINLIFGPADVLFPTTTEFLNKDQFVSVFKVVREATGVRFHKRLTLKVLEIIFEKNALVPIYSYGKLIRISKDYLEIFKAQAFTKKEQIITFLEKRKASLS